MPPSIVNARHSDLEFMYWMFDQAIVYQKEKGFPVWPDYDREILKRDIEQQLQFKLLIEGEIALIFSVSYEDKIVWRERDIGNAIYLHRIVVNPQHKGKKLFGDVLSWAQQKARAQGLPLIRMDTWANNPTIIDYYKSFDFKEVGHFKNPDSEDMPIQLRGNRVVLLEYQVI